MSELTFHYALLLKESVSQINRALLLLLRPPNFHRNCSGWLPLNQHRNTTPPPSCKFLPPLQH